MKAKEQDIIDVCNYAIRDIVQIKLKNISEGPTAILKRLFIDNYPKWYK